MHDCPVDKVDFNDFLREIKFILNFWSHKIAQKGPRDKFLLKKSSRN